ncbi:hypothetical protein, partial [Thiosulfatihalobacter marinus]|uniref:hypothetical protein n=1 Tax=Thiosulfatihalobacter marinus TaxID=2792481 RepID=UPI001E4A67F0
ATALQIMLTNKRNVLDSPKAPLRHLSLSATPEAQAEDFQGRQNRGSSSLHSVPQDRQHTSAKKSLNLLTYKLYQ